LAAYSILVVMADARTGPEEAAQIEVWRQACHRVLTEAGRARLHDVRAVLNSVAVSAEVLHLTSAVAPAPAPATATQMLNAIRHGLAAASAELTGLEALVTQTAGVSPVRWSQAVEWAVSVIEPVARRRRITVVPPATLPLTTADDGAGLCTALVLIEAVGAAPDGSSCVMRAIPEPASLVIEWVTSTGPSSDSLAPRLLAMVFGARARWSHEGDHRRLDLALAAPPPLIEVPHG
jgi:hypothetical protein